MRSQYAVIVTTTKSFPPSEHEEAAVRIVEQLEAMLTDSECVLHIFGATSMQSSHTECEVQACTGDGPVVVKALITAEAEEKALLDKNKLTQAVRNSLDYTVKVQKREFQM